MSFNQFSAELLIYVFSHLLDIPSKIRLERVSRRFRDCIRNVESWKYNTTLSTLEFESNEELQSFLRHAKLITKLELDCSGIPPKYFSTLFMFSNKLKITHLFYDLDEDQITDCPKYAQALACCLGKFASSLKFVDISCCGTIECPVLDTLLAQFPLCPNLRELWLGYIRDDEDTTPAQANNKFMLDCLMNLSLSDLNLINFFSTVNGERLAAVCNSAKDYCLSKVTVKRYLGYPPESMRFQLAPFCQALEPGAAQAIKCLELEYIDCDWIDLLPTFPGVFANLTSLKIVHSPTNPTVEDVSKIGEALGDFLHASAQHEEALSLEIIFACERGEEQEQSPFGRWLWSSVNLIDAWRSGTKRTSDMQHWKRTLSHGNVTVSIELE